MPTAPDTTRRARPPRGPISIFMVEDEPLVQDSLRVVLGGFLGAEVVGSANTEAEAISWLQAHDDAWRLAVVDLFLQQGTGLGVLSWLAPLKNGRTVIALTNAATRANRAQCLQLGADAVFDKSEEINEFLSFCENASTGSPAALPAATTRPAKRA
ncbi:response regulator [Variovorax sp.]|jgi:DNA-binding NarL/FixJ family response regulator|uniref:response regulator n=1 Tax=Variovorax sp. TaxID=1871043 RepID=UPI003BA85FA9